MKKTAYNYYKENENKIAYYIFGIGIILYVKSTRSEVGTVQTTEEADKWMEVK